MSVASMVFLSFLAAVGIALICYELFRYCKTRKEGYICVCFEREMFENARPDVIFICRTEQEQEEILRRISDSDDRRMYIKRR